MKGSNLLCWKLAILVVFQLQLSAQQPTVLSATPVDGSNTSITWSWDEGQYPYVQLWVFPSNQIGGSYITTGETGLMETPVTWIGPEVIYRFALFKATAVGAEYRGDQLVATTVARSANSKPTLVTAPLDGSYTTIAWQWDSGAYSDSHVTLIENGGEERFMGWAAGGVGSEWIPWINPANTYQFSLYGATGTDPSQRGPLLREVFVGEPPPSGPQVISVTPIQGPDATVSWQWDTNSWPKSQVTVTVGNGEELQMSYGEDPSGSGSQFINWYYPENNTYRFALYGATGSEVHQRGPLLAEIQVGGIPPTPVDPSISATPLQGSNTSISWEWDTGAHPFAHVYLIRSDTGSVQHFGTSSSGSGSIDINWIDPTVLYRFELYSGSSDVPGNDRANFLSQVTVGSPNNPNSITTTRVKNQETIIFWNWDTDKSQSSELTVTRDSNPEQPLAVGSTGAQSVWVNWIYPNTTFRFTTYDSFEGSRGRYQDELTIKDSYVHVSATELILDPGQLGHVQITWSSRYDEAQLIVRQDSNPEQVFGPAPEGSGDYPWVVAGSTYRFTLYDGVVAPGKEFGTALEQVVVTGIPSSDYPDGLVSPAGQTAHKEQLWPLEPISGGWDGRLYVSTVPVKDANGDIIFRPDGAIDNFNYGFFLFRPEATSISDNETPDFTGAAFSPNMEMVANDPSPNRLHATIFPDSRYPQKPGTSPHGMGPYPSWANGDYDRNGTHETYRFGLVGREEKADFPVAGNTMSYLTMIHAMVVVEHPNTASARIISATQEQNARILYDTNGGELFGYEPSMSLDGRLLVWSGRYNDREANNGTTMYSFNPNPNTPTGWSPPKPISSLYWQHGPGAVVETQVGGRPFSEMYPIAARPLRDPGGRIFQDGEVTHGPYPWLSYDATEIFFNAVRVYYGSARTGSSVVGARTDWTIRHIDGALNPTRSNLPADGSAGHFVDTPEGAAIEAAYKGAVLQDGTPLGEAGHLRILISPVSLGGSMWGPYDNRDDLRKLEAGRSNTYNFVLSSSRRFVEVPLDQVDDGKYLLYWPMNEQIEYDADAALRAYVNWYPGGTPGNIWTEYVNAVHFAPEATPDVSGNLNNGLLEPGALFPFEFNKAVDLWNDEGSVAGDVIEGIVGNAIHFDGGGFVSGSLNDTTFGRLSNARALTVGLWLKPKTSSAAYYVAQLGDSVFLRYGFGGLEATLITKNGSAIISTDGVTTGAWNHVALRYDGHRVELFLNGEAVAEQALDGTMRANMAMVRVGPYDGVNGMKLCLIDEFWVSDVARDDAFIRKAALIKEDTAVQNFNTVIPQSLGDLAQFFPEGHGYNATIASLGRDLFFDPILSGDQSVSCGSCHDPNKGFSDGRVRALGVEGKTGARNTPTIINRLFSKKQFMDGRAGSLEEQALGPIVNPMEMNLPLDEAIARLRSGDYASRFQSAFNLTGPLEPKHLARALATYERTLISGNSPHDLNQLTSREQNGKELFFGKARCSGCHAGPNFTDEQFHNVGIGINNNSDRGLENKSGSPADRGRFKTPTLRNIAQTAPYFHDGRLATLADVIDFYDRAGDDADHRSLNIKPLNLTTEEKQDLAAFLEALTGTVTW